VARATFDAVARKDPGGIVALGAPGYVDDFVAIGEFRGRDAVRDFFRELFAACPDLEMTVVRVVADDASTPLRPAGSVPAVRRSRNHGRTGGSPPRAGGSATGPIRR
jgi:ketosteroid isomerase-like protein